MFSNNASYINNCLESLHFVKNSRTVCLDLRTMIIFLQKLNIANIYYCLYVLQFIHYGYKVNRLRFNK